MLAIRMRRLGAKKRPFFRVVVIDSHAARDGRALEVLGHYNPTSVPETFKVNQERLEHWVSRGAQPSDTLRTLLTRHPEGEALEEATPASAPRTSSAAVAAPRASAAPAVAEAPPVVAEEPAAAEAVNSSEEPEVEAVSPASEAPAAEEPKES